MRMCWKCNLVTGIKQLPHNMHTANSENKSTNVFEDLGFPDAKERFVKVQLAFKIATLVGKRKKVDAARLLGIDQEKVSLLIKGKNDDFSIDQLKAFLTELSKNTGIVVNHNIN